jgi:hypothetical protein
VLEEKNYTKMVSTKWRPLMLMFLVLVPQLEAAVVAQDKVFEMVHQARQIFANLTGPQTDASLLPSADAEVPIVDPLSLELAVLQVTDSLSREMSSPTWQAMLRALGGDREILKRFAQLRPRFAAIEKRLTRGQVEDHFSLLGDSMETPWTRLWPQLQTLIETVGNLHDWFDRYQRNSAVVNERTLRDYAETVHGSDGLTTVKAIESIHKAICPENPNQEEYHDQWDCSGGAFDILKNATMQASDGFICSLSKSPHQFVYDLYSLLALTEAKGYAMMQFSWMLLRLYGKGNFTQESEMARADFERRVAEKAQAARNVLSQLPTWMWKCDTPQSEQIENETYIQFTELLQGYIVNEVDMNQDKTCKDSCSAYTNSQEQGCFGNQFCSKSRRCPKGRIYNCGFVEADSTVCTTDEPGRRYSWIEYKSGRVFGQKSECKQPGQSKNTVDSWWRWLFWHCSYCTCLCDQPGLKSDRYISLLPALANAKANHVVTGLRFVKEGRVVHVQIQEGAALPRGMVNASTLQWKTVKPVDIPAHREESLEDGPGYATLRYEERAVDLDDLVAPEGYVVTGLRFRKLGGHVNLEMQVSPIGFATGLIEADRATWISNDNTPANEVKPRVKMSLVSPDVPTLSTTPSVPDSNPDQYIEFQASSLEKDVSQTTVPFLDAQPVFPVPSTWLTGIGLYHKGQPGYGGFLAFRVATLNVSDYMVMPTSGLFQKEDV